MRIAIVNNTLLAAEALRRVIHAAKNHQVAWLAHNGAEAVRRCAADKPDLILMDLLMPEMDGVEATRRIMAATPCPILIVTGSVAGQVGRVFEAMGAGALDAVNTPVLGQDPLTQECAGCVGLLHKIATIEKLTAPSVRPHTHAVAATTLHASAPAGPLVVIGASTGGPGVLAEILAQLPADYPVPIVIVQHVDVQFADALCHWLDQHTPLTVRIAREGERPAPGRVLVAGTQHHLVMRADGSVGYTAVPEDHPYRPSVDVFFHSVAAHWSGPGVAVLLTGMGRDGAQGLLALRNHGMHTLTQDRASCAVYGMPKAAVELNAAAQILTPHAIAAALRNPIHANTVSAPCAWPSRRGLS